MTRRVGERILFRSSFRTSSKIFGTLSPFILGLIRKQQKIPLRSCELRGDFLFDQHLLQGHARRGNYRRFFAAAFLAGLRFATTLRFAGFLAFFLAAI